MPTLAGTYAPPMGFAGPMSPWAAPSPWNWGWATPTELGWGLGGGRRWGGTYTPQFLMTGLPTDNEIVEMTYDAIDADPIIPFDAPIDVSSDAGTVTLTGTIFSKEIKHAAGDDAWYIPGVIDVRNELEVSGRRHEGRKAP
ncbi:MAG: BON domain-containing protein, partial [Chloroflexota bacterium]